MNVDVLTAPAVYQIAGISRDELNRLVHRKILTVPSVAGPHDNSPRQYTRLGFHEAVILSALHLQCGVTWPKAALVFERFAGLLVEGAADERSGYISAKASSRILNGDRGLVEPVFLLFMFGRFEDEVHVDIAYGWEGTWGLFTKLRGARQMKSAAAWNGFGTLNLTTLLAEADAALASMEAE